ncbi:hypothetical protein [Rhizobium phage RHph_X2_26]|nr:hypothetical protein [Rhizobium phage RHph_X2_26]
MAITFPYDLLAGFPGWLLSANIDRRQEQSRSAFGATFVKDLGDPIWKTSYGTKELAPNALDDWRAKLDVLDNGLNTFKAYILTRCYPIAYPRGAWPTGGAFNGSGTIGAIGLDNKTLTISGFPVGYVFTRGDILMIGSGRCYRVVTGGTVPSGGTSPLLEVRPHLRVGTAIGNAVSVKNPWVLSTIDPGSISDPAGLNGRGAITFSATESV